MKNTIIDDILSGALVNEINTPSEEMRISLIKVNDCIKALKETLSTSQNLLLNALLIAQSEYNEICTNEYLKRGYSIGRKI